ncbi:MAG: 2-phospho-L-lactate transferase [Rhizobiales bacterium]|nr:2-phospho-L-lactate transferase [Hyphomicrobiales bacterium]
MSGPRILALSGGIGGAKLALGLYRLLGERLTVVVNTGDDFTHLGLAISPDVDTTLYTLADLVDPAKGWGRRDETWTFMKVLGELGGPTWFNLGDGDLALHVERTRRLAAGARLTDVTDAVRQRFGLSCRILPMSDEPVATLVETDIGPLAFQEYFVREQCRPRLRSIRYEGADRARVTPEIAAAIADPALGGIVVCPSNPYLSVAPILAVPGMRELLESAPAPVIAVSPLVAGKAIKGPTAKIMDELGHAASAATIASHYRGLIDGFIVDEADADLVGTLGVRGIAAKTVMHDEAEKIALAEVAIRYCQELREQREWVR